jgi:hypothetical protein
MFLKKWIYFNIHNIVKYQPHLYPRSVTTFWDPKNVHFYLRYLKTWFNNNWPDDDSVSRNMSPLYLTIN